MNIKVLKIPTEGDMEVVTIDDFRSLQEHVGGDIEVLATPWDEARLVVDDAGRLKAAYSNMRATILTAGMHGPIVGDVVLIGWDSNDEDNPIRELDNIFFMMAGVDPNAEEEATCP